VRWLRDIYGNSIAVLTFEESSQRLSVASEVDVELYDDNPIECSWLNTVIEYSGIQNSTVLRGVWFDNGSAAPTSPSDADFRSEAANAVNHFFPLGGGTGSDVLYVIATASGNNPSSFPTLLCAYHSFSTFNGGKVGYMALPYITDAGAGCGANFNGLGPNAGITIVAGTQFANWITDPFDTGWFDSNLVEIGSKCAFDKTTTNVTLTDGNKYPLSPLWSNAAKNKECVLFF